MSNSQITSHWIKTQLGNIATFQRGNDLPYSNRESGKFPVIGSNGVSGYHSEFVAAAPGVLVGRSGSVGKVSWVDNEFWPLNTALWVKDFHGNDPKFIYYFLNFLDLGKYATGVSVPTLNRNLIHPLEVCIPPLPEQRAIAHTLRAVQQAKEARQRELELERERKAALMDDLFTKSMPGESRKQTEIGEIPESWEVIKLEECLILPIKNGLYKPSNFIGIGQSKLIELSSLYGCERVLEVNHKFKFIEVTKNEILKYALQNEDVLINRVSKQAEGIAQARLVRIEENFSYPVVFESNMFRARFNNKILPKYFSFYASTIFYLTQVIAKAQKANQTSINQPSINSVLIPCPSISEQLKIISILEACDNKIICIEKELLLLDELFQAMLEELMTGRLSATSLINMEENQ